MVDLGLIYAAASFLGVHLIWAICGSIVKIISLKVLPDFDIRIRDDF